MDRWARALASALAVFAVSAAPALAAGPPFPDPVDQQAVYDEADVLSAGVEADLEGRIDAVEAATGAEVVVYTQVDPDISEDENLANAAALIDQWGIGRSGFDDGLVLMLGLQENRINGRVSLYGGSGFTSQHIDESSLTDIIDRSFVPLALDGDLEGATVATITTIQDRVAAETLPLTAARVANAALGLIGAPVALLGIVGVAWWKWRREGDDPELIDSPSILMAGPPAGMTPPLATVVRAGRADQHSTNTILAELASTGRLAFRNLDRVSEVKSDDEADALTDPAIEVRRDAAAGDDALPRPEREAWSVIQKLAGSSDRLSRERLWRLNSELDRTHRTLEADALRLGWFTDLPSRAIGRMTGVGIAVAVIGAVVGGLGAIIPMSGAVLLGAAVALGGIGVIGFGRAMSQRSPQGAYVDAMLKAYRRTLAKTMELSRNMGEVVRQPDVAALADTPDKAVVWGVALGLHAEVAAVLARGLEEQRQASGTPAGAYYPVWLGSAPGSALGDGGGSAPGGVSEGAGSIFSGSAIPDIGGMFDALGSVGSTPPSSPSSGGGGGFSGGSSSGGGGGSGSF